MCVSKKICEQHIDILIDLLKSNIDFGVKSNIIISMGDLFKQFPNTIVEYTKDIFMLLHDKENAVRR